MIQIAPPQQIRVETDGASSDSSEMTREAFDSPLDHEYRLAPEPESADREPSLEGRTVVAPPVASEPTWSASATSAPLMPNQQWTSPSAARTRQILLVSFLGLGGVLLAGVLFVGFLRWYRGSNQLASGQAAQQAAANAPMKPPAEAPSEPSIESASTQSGEPLADATEVDPLDSLPDGKAVPAMPPGVMPTPNDLTVPVIETPPNKSSNDASTAPMVAPQTPAEASPANKPADINSVSNVPAETGAAPAGNSPLPEQLAKFGKLLERSFEPDLPQEGIEIQKPPPTLEELGLPTAEAAKALPPVDVSKQLESKLEAIAIPETLPLSHAMNLWTLISGIPTVTDLDSLTAAGFYFPPLSIKLSIKPTSADKFVPMSQVADVIREQLKVELEPIDNRFMVLHADQKLIADSLPKSIDAKGLLGADPAWMESTLNRIFPEHAGKWKLSDQTLSADAGVELSTWLWVVRLFEGWRLAAGQPTQLEKLDPKRFVTRMVDTETLDALDRPLALVIKEPQATAQLISQIGTAAGFQTWIDWPGVAVGGLGPGSTDLVVTHQRSPRQCLRSLAEKYGLVVACEDEKTLWITSVESYRQQVRLYVLPAQGKTIEQWQEELQPLTPVSASGGELIQTILTPDNAFVIVRCCRPRVRF